MTADRNHEPDDSSRPSGASDETSDMVKPENPPPAVIDSVGRQDGGGAISFLFSLRKRHLMSVLIMAVVSLITGILDGIGLSLIAPTVEFLIESESANSSNVILEWAEAAFDAIGIAFTLGWTLAMVGVVMTIRSIALLGQAWVFATLSTRFESELRITGFRSIMNAGWPYFLKQQSGNVTIALTTEAQRAGEAFAFTNVAIG